jgi:hypothetical protein
MITASLSRADQNDMKDVFEIVNPEEIWKDLVPIPAYQSAGY